MNEQAQQEFLEQKLKEFTEKMQDVSKSVLADIYSDYLPHVLSDTECNVSFQASDALRRILQGDFKVDGDYLRVGDLSVYLKGFYSDIANRIYKAAPDKIESLAIRELESKIEVLEQELRTAYDRW